MNNHSESTVEAGDAGDNGLHWLRLNLSVVVGDTTVRSNLWTGTHASQPTGWELDTTQSPGDHTSGFCGFVVKRRESNIYWYRVGTGGAAAPPP